ncbi:DUF1254 domain-containing protein [Methylovirgula sp. 4M-Z18]|uniref:DUF1254 domain-containing protein n=1 Tax=Methylovirgula sp. 4M-Z18 TaxID=2293567 RepID=UPI0011C0519A|nr:DUF1254 domain-containing protein [Methylovirgula sp. 4M-Z18]
MKRPDFFSLLQWILATVILAGGVHLASVLLLPRVAPADSFARMAALAPVNTLKHLPAARPGETLTVFRDPALAEAVCPYDLDQGPLRLSGTVSRDGFVSASFHNRRGIVFYAVTDQAATRGRLSALVVTQDQLDAIKAQESDDEPVQELRIVSPTRRGFVVVRALSSSVSQYAEAEAELDAFGCETSHDEPTN